MGTREEALHMEPARRNVEGHPGPDVPRVIEKRDVDTGEWRPVAQLYACETPEMPQLDDVLYHGDCRACMVMLHAMVANYDGIIFMTHGRTVRRADGSFFR
jgi:hypothetical protein